MYKIKLTGYDLQPGSERYLTLDEVGQLRQQSLMAHNGKSWRLVRRGADTYVLRWRVVHDVKYFDLEITC